MRVVVLSSGRGSNLEAIIKGQKNYQVVGVVSDVPNANALNIANDAGIPSIALNGRELKKDALIEPLIEAARSFTPDWIALAGFLRIVRPAFLEAFEGRVLNVHPSLLPKYPGLRTHEEVLEAGEPIHGCTIHLVDEGIDTGKRIAQAIVPVFPKDTIYTLSDRVLAVEHILYPWVLNSIGSGDIRIQKNVVEISSPLREEAKRAGFIL